MQYSLKVIFWGLLWLAMGFGYGAGMGLALGWGPYTAVPASIATVYSGAAYIHFWRSPRYMSLERELVFSLLPWYLMLGSVVTFAIWGIRFANVNSGWCVLYALTAAVLLLVTMGEAFKTSLVLSFLPPRAYAK